MCYILVFILTKQLTLLGKLATDLLKKITVGYGARRSEIHRHEIWWISARLHDVRSQQTLIFIVTTMWIWCMSCQVLRSPPVFLILRKRIQFPPHYIRVNSILCCTSKSSNWFPTLLVFRLNQCSFLSLVRETCLDRLIPSWFDRPNNDVSGEKEVSCCSPYSVVASSHICLVISIVSNMRNL